MKFIKVALFLCLSLPAISQSSVIPQFKFLKLKDGELFTNKDMKPGRKSLFIFFDVTCPHCQEAITFFNKNAEKLATTAVYLITIDNKTLAINFLNANATKLIRVPNTVVLYDGYNEFIQKFKPVKYPSMFLYSKTKQLMIYSDEPKDAPRFLRSVKEK